MTQTQAPRVQHRPFGLARPSTSILRIARNRMAERREMDANLVRAPGVQITAQECMRAALFDHLVARARKPPAFDHRHALAILRMAADRPFQLSRSRLDRSTHDR